MDKLSKKRFGAKSTRQPAPEHSSSHEGINPHLEGSTQDCSNSLF